MAEAGQKVTESDWREGIRASCPNCEEPLATNAKSCPECGHQLRGAAHCTQSGAKLAEGAKFCAECGTKAG
jgi:rRNA maturation endonuclease Nob1